MGRKKKFGTHAIGGLNTRVVPHAIDDHELQECVNASFDRAGAAAPLGEDTELYGGSGYAGVQIKALQLAGVEHLYWLSDTDIYEDDSVIGGGASVARPIIGDGERIYFLDGSSSQVYDGTYMRDLGGPGGVVEADNRAYALMNDAETSISAASNGTDIQITAALTHYLYVGGRIIFRDMVGGTWDTLDDTVHVVKSIVSDTVFTIEADGSGLGTFTSGKFQASSGTSGSYQYAAATAVVFPDGRETESDLVKMWNWDAGDEYVSFKNPLEVSATDNVQLYVRMDGDQTTGYISPTTSIEVKLRIYRTKAGGASYYLLKEWDDSELDGDRAIRFQDGAYDTDLGAVWTYDDDAHGAPPAATLGCIVQQRMFLAGVSGSETNLYFSRISGYDYYKPTDYVDVEARISALAPLADRVVVFTADRIGTYSPIDEIGQFQWSLSPVGTEYEDSVVVTEEGVLFARDDGLWLFDGVTSRCLTEDIADEWDALSGGPWTVARTLDTVYCGTSGGALSASIVKGQWMWTTLSGSYSYHVCSSVDGTALYGLIENNGEYGIGPVSVFAGSNRTMTIRTKDWGGWKIWEGLQLDLNATGQDFVATVYTSDGDSQAISFDGSATRGRYRQMLPRDLRGEYHSVKIVGDVTAYGVELMLS